jgi:hypothetical protein
VFVVETSAKLSRPDIIDRLLVFADANHHRLHFSARRTNFPIALKAANLHGRNFLANHHENRSVGKRTTGYPKKRDEQREEIRIQQPDRH